MGKALFGAALSVGAPNLRTFEAMKAPVRRPLELRPEKEQIPLLELPPAVDAEDISPMDAREVEANLGNGPGPCLSALMQGLQLTAGASQALWQPLVPLTRNLPVEDAVFAKSPPKVARPRPLPAPLDLLACLPALELPEAELSEVDAPEILRVDRVASASPLPQAAAVAWSESDEESLSPGIAAWIAAKDAIATVEAAAELEFAFSDEGNFCLDEEVFQMPVREKYCSKMSPRMSLCSTLASTPRQSVLSVHDWQGISF